MKKENQGYLLTDDGYILTDLEDSSKCRALIASTLAGFGVSLQGDALIIRADASNFLRHLQVHDKRCSRGPSDLEIRSRGGGVEARVFRARKIPQQPHNRG